MPLQIVCNDITKMHVDAIVNPANHTLIPNHGMCRAIHIAAGPLLEAECQTLNGSEKGDAKITKSYELPCKYVIHTVGPNWRDGFYKDQEILTSCYWKSILLAQEYGCESIAFPIIQSIDYPKDKALRIAMHAISEFLLNNACDIIVYLVVAEKSIFQINKKQCSFIDEYIRSHRRECHSDTFSDYEIKELPPCPASSEPICPSASDFFFDDSLSLEEVLKHVDESFSQMVLRKI